jgi:hypothetical protein
MMVAAQCIHACRGTNVEDVAHSHSQPGRQLSYIANDDHTRFPGPKCEEIVAPRLTDRSRW